MVERRSWIPMEDGVRLAASLYVPDPVDAGEPVPVVLEALPYRKDDATASCRPEYERLCGEYGYFVRHATRPAPDLDELDGGGRDEPVWPPERARSLTLPLSGAAPASKGVDRLAVRADVASAAWISCAGHLPFGQPDDQRTDDAWSLVYDWEPDEELEVLGHPRLAVRVGSSAPVAFLSAKLCDVFPDGTSALAARGLARETRARAKVGERGIDPPFSFCP
jgi:predicted acyl esterase